MNSIYCGRCPNQEGRFSIQNRTTGSLYDVLSLSTSCLAQTDGEKRFAAFFDGMDRIGLGTADLDVCDLPWATSRGELQRQKESLLKAVAESLDQRNWQMLDYDPRAYELELILPRLASLVAHITVEHLVSGAQQDNENEPADHVELCSEHRLYFFNSWGCCRICCGDFTHWLPQYRTLTGEAPRKRFVFKPCGDSWQMAFATNLLEGESAVVAESAGLHSIHRLLKNPSTSISLSELESPASVQERIDLGLSELKSQGLVELVTHLERFIQKDSSSFWYRPKPFVPDWDL